MNELLEAGTTNRSRHTDAFNQMNDNTDYEINRSILSSDYCTASDDAEEHESQNQRDDVSDVHDVPFSALARLIDCLDNLSS